MGARQGLIREQAIATAFILAVVVATLMLVSPDSPLHYANARYDSATFMTAAVAWAHGMTPYVDFADSKGPLLWLIYRVGYTLSPGSYLGVFILSVLSYCAVLAVIWRMVRRELGTSWQAHAVAALMLLAFFNPVFFNEVRAEDFAQLPLLTCMAATWAAHRDSLSTSRAAALQGLALGALTLIKFNLAAMAVVWTIILLVTARRQWGRVVVATLAGFLLMVLPWLAYFWHEGALGAFFTEYFIHTATTTATVTHLGLANYLAGWGRIGLLTMLSLAVMAIGIAWWCWHRKEHRLPLWVAFVWFLAVTMLLARQGHHWVAMSLFALPGAAALLGWLGRFGRARHAVVTAAVLLALAVALLQNYRSPNYHDNFRYYLRTESLAEHNALAQHIVDTRARRIVYLMCQDVGFGYRLPALPACRYWFTQAGATPAMQADQWQCIEAHRADAVMLFTRNRKHAHDRLVALGYQPFTPPVTSPRYTLYTLPDTLRQPQK